MPKVVLFTVLFIFHLVKSQNPEEGGGTGKNLLNVENDCCVNCNNNSQGYCGGDSSYKLTKIGNIALSKEHCPSGSEIPRSSSFCVPRPSNASIEGEYKGYFIEEVSTDCNANLSSLLRQDQNNSILLENFTYLLSQLHIFTSNVNSVDLNSANDTLNVLYKVERFARAGTIEIDTRSSLRYIAFIISQLSKFYENQNKKNESVKLQELQQRTTRILPELCLSARFSINCTSWGVNTGRFFMMAENHGSAVADNAIFSPKVAIDKIEPPVKVFVPSSVINSVRDAQNCTRTVFIYYYNNSSFFATNGENIQNIVSVNVGRNETATANLSEDVVITHFDIEKEVNETVTCVFWDFTNENWSGEGCTTNFYPGNKTVECRCKHLTNFALLVSSRPNQDQELLSKIGGFISIVGLLITIVLFSCYKELRKYRPGKILLHLCCNLCISYIVFIVGAFLNAENRSLCVALAFLFHYFYLVSWSWMGIYGYEIYNGLVKVFHVHQSQFMLKASLLSYSVPAVIAFVTFSVAIGAYAPEEETLNFAANYASDTCQLTREHHLYLAYIIPIGIVLVFNVIVFVLVMLELKKKKEPVSPSIPQRSVKESITIAFSMISVMGLCWVFGYVPIFFKEDEQKDDTTTKKNTFLDVINCIFVVLAAFQGFAIFFFTVAQRKNVRKLLWDSYRKHCLECKTKRNEALKSMTVSIATTTPRTNLASKSS